MATGLPIASVECDTLTGTIRVVAGQPGAISEANPWDEVLTNAANQKRPA
jgi:hypothetical protein